jgi:hypothetical protein
MTVLHFTVTLKISMIVGFITTYSVQSVPIATDVVSSNPTHCEVRNIM